MTKACDIIHETLTDYLQGRTGVQLMMKPRGEFQKYTVYRNNSVIGTLSMSTNGLRWKSKNRGMIKMLKRLAKRINENRGGDRVSSGIA
jgi:hypothetical protein